MDFSWSEEQSAFRESVRRFAEREISPGYKERDAAGEFNFEGWKKAADFGLLGLPIPEEYGGAGADILTTLIGYEGFGHGCKDTGFAVSMGAHTVICEVPIWKFGTEEQRREYLPRMTTGEWVGGFGLTEPNAGSDVGSIQTTATRAGDSYVLNGSKIFITNGSIGSLFVVVASTDRTQRSRGLTAFLVEKDFPGFKAARDLDKVGLRSSPTSELIFEDCRVPAGNVLGEEGQGFAIGMETLEWERACLIAWMVGTMEQRLEEVIEYTKQRVQFGRPIAEFQAVRHTLADMKVALEAARLLVYRVGWKKQQGLPALMDASIAKLFLTENNLHCAVENLKLYGGYGVIREFDAEKHLRDALPGPIGGGTSNIQRTIIARELLKG